MASFNKSWNCHLEGDEDEDEEEDDDDNNDGDDDRDKAASLFISYFR